MLTLTRFFNKCAEIFKIFKSSEEGKFNFTEKIEDHFVGAFYEQNLLIFVKQMPWFTKDDMANSLKKLLGIIKNDYNNLFI